MSKSIAEHMYVSNVVKGVFVVQSQQTKRGSPLFLFISWVIYLTDVCTWMLSLQMSSLGFTLVLSQPYSVRQ